MTASGWGPPDPRSRVDPDPTFWTTPQPPYVWPFGQGPDPYAVPAAPVQSYLGWGPPQTTWVPPRRRAMPYVVAALIIMVGLVAAGGAVLLGSGEGLTYRNESYVPPQPDPSPPPIPTAPTPTAAEQFTADNPLYAQRTPSPIRCELVPLTTTSSPADLERHGNELTACLMRTWVVPVKGAGFELYRPTVTVISAKTNSRCGELDTTNAFYCVADQQIYIGTDLVKQFARTPIAVDMIIAHEFGHLVQARTTILASARAIQQGAGKDDQLRLNRRIELQADCFAGLWIHTVSRSMGWGPTDDQVFADAIDRAGDRPGREGDHGQSANRVAWLRTGLGTTDIGRCNTFTAADDRVK